MASAQRLFPALAVLLAVCVAAEAVSTPSLTDLMRNRVGRQGARVSTASMQEDYGYEQYGIETKELCLQESEMKTCGWVQNCIDDDAGAANAAPANDPTPECVIGQFWTSDFACCQEQHYGYDSPSGLRHSQLWSSSASIGTCDWTVLYVDERNLDFTYTPAGGSLTTVSGSTDITANIARLGTAWATCYMGPDSDSCGGPLCDRMVMSLQGTVYRASTAYSHWGASVTRTSPFCAFVNGPSMSVTDTNNPGRIAQPGIAAPRTAAPAPINTPVRTASEGSASLQYNGGYHGHYDDHDTTKTVYFAPATIIMGIVNGMAGQHKEKWDEGVFEYVPFFGNDNGVVTAVTAGTALDQNNPWVRDKTYKLTFYRGAKY